MTPPAGGGISGNGKSIRLVLTKINKLIFISSTYLHKNMYNFRNYLLCKQLLVLGYRQVPFAVQGHSNLLEHLQLDLSYRQF